MTRFPRQGQDATGNELGVAQCRTGCSADTDGGADNTTLHLLYTDGGTAEPTTSTKQLTSRHVTPHPSSLTRATEEATS